MAAMRAGPWRKGTLVLDSILKDIFSVRRGPQRRFSIDEARKPKRERKKEAFATGHIGELSIRICIVRSLLVLAADLWEILQTFPTTRECQNVRLGIR